MMTTSKVVVIYIRISSNAPRMAHSRAAALHCDCRVVQVQDGALGVVGEGADCCSDLIIHPTAGKT